MVAVTAAFIWLQKVWRQLDERMSSAPDDIAVLNQSSWHIMRYYAILSLLHTIYTV